MILAVDVHYRDSFAKAVGILFNWNDEHPQKVIIKILKNIEEYIPGEFYKRELPCILEVLKELDLSEIESILVDGHVYVDNQKRNGLGAHLYKELNEKIPIIGVAKTSFQPNMQTVKSIYRGESTKPLFISVIGIDLMKSVDNIRNMKGEYRIPTVLKELDRITKTD